MFNAKPVDFYLIRGLAREAAHWGGFDEALRQQKYSQSVSCIELPGTGRFHKLLSPITIRGCAEFLLSQIDPGKAPKVLVSISLGSMVAVEMARLRPDLFSQVYVMNTSFSNLSPFYHRLQLRALKNFWSMAKSKSLKDREFECLKMVSQKSGRWQELSEEFAKVAELRPISLQNLFRQLLAASAYKVAKEKLQTPVTVINSEGDNMVDPSCSQKIADHWGVEKHTHPWAGHDIPVDDPSWVLETLEKTLLAADS